MSLFRCLRSLVLATASPRRRAFLDRLGLPFEPFPSVAPEPQPESQENPLHYVGRCAESKAQSVLEQLRSRRRNPELQPLEPAVLAADTIVILQENGVERILGKPKDRDDAVAILSHLNGRTHRVATACCLAVDGKFDNFTDVTEVTFAKWPREVLEAYADSGDPMDKAGAYGMQDGGTFLVERINGSWSTVVGLPLDIVLRHLLENKIIAPVPSSQEEVPQ